MAASDKIRRGQWAIQCKKITDNSIGRQVGVALPWRFTWGSLGDGLRGRVVSHECVAQGSGALTGPVGLRWARWRQLNEGDKCGVCLSEHRMAGV